MPDFDNMVAVLLLNVLQERHEDVETLITLSGTGDRSATAWWLRGAAGYHDGTAPGLGGTGWTREEAGHHVEGWEAAAVWDGNYRVEKDEVVPPDGNECDHCLAPEGNFHVQGCYHLDGTAPPLPKVPKAEPLDLQEALKALWESLADGMPVRATGDGRAQLERLFALQRVADAKSIHPRATVAIQLSDIPIRSYVEMIDGSPVNEMRATRLGPGRFGGIQELHEIGTEACPLSSQTDLPTPEVVYPPAVPAVPARAELQGTALMLLRVLAWCASGEDVREAVGYMQEFPNRCNDGKEEAAVVQALRDTGVLAPLPVEPETSEEQLAWQLCGRGVIRLLLNGDEVARIRPYMTNETPVAGWRATAEGAWCDAVSRMGCSLSEVWSLVRDLAAEREMVAPPLPPEAEAVDRVFRLEAR